MGFGLIDLRRQARKARAQPAHQSSRPMLLAREEQQADNEKENALQERQHEPGDAEHDEEPARGNGERTLPARPRLGHVNARDGGP